MKSRIFPGWFYFFAVTFSAMLALVYAALILTGHGTVLNFLALFVHSVCFWINLRGSKG